MEMIQEEHGFYNPYPFQPQSATTIPTAPLGTVDDHADPYIQQEQVETQPTGHPSGPLPAPYAPMPPVPPQKRKGRTGLIVIIVLVLAIIFGLALFAAGWEYASN